MKLSIFSLILLLTGLVSMPLSALAEVTKLEPISITEQKTYDPFTEGFKRYAQELKAYQRDDKDKLLQESVDGFAKDLMKNANSKKSSKTIK